MKAKVQVSKEEAETILKVIAKEKSVAEQKLKAAEPALLAAESALQVSPVFTIIDLDFLKTYCIFLNTLK